MTALSRGAQLHLLTSHTMCAEPGEVPCQCNLLVETRVVVSYASTSHWPCGRVLMHVEHTTRCTLAATTVATDCNLAPQPY
jgi:hypothetical protein